MGDFHHGESGWVVPGTPCLQETHSTGCASVCSTTHAPSLPSSCHLPPVLHPHPTTLLAVPSRGAGLRGPVPPVALCCSPRDEFGDLGASTGPLPTPAGRIWPPACLPHFPGPGNQSMGFMVSCAPFAVEPVPLLG